MSAETTVAWGHVRNKVGKLSGRRQMDWQKNNYTKVCSLLTLFAWHPTVFDYYSIETQAFSSWVSLQDVLVYFGSYFLLVFVLQILLHICAYWWFLYQFEYTSFGAAVRKWRELQATCFSKEEVVIIMVDNDLYGSKWWVMPASLLI